jgi:hypothetical protein
MTETGALSARLSPLIVTCMALFILGSGTTVGLSE